MNEAVAHLSALEIFAFLCSYLGGVLVNYVVKTKREHMGWKEYWTLNPVSSIASVLVSTGMFITLLSQQQTDHLTYFSLAFTVENLINTQATKGEKPREEDKQSSDSTNQ